MNKIFAATMLVLLLGIFSEVIVRSQKTTATATTYHQSLLVFAKALNQQVAALEKELALDKPDAKKVATLTAAVQTNLDAMSKLDETNPMSKFTMKM